VKIDYVQILPIRVSAALAPDCCFEPRDRHGAEPIAYRPLLCAATQARDPNGCRAAAEHKPPVALSLFTAATPWDRAAYRNPHQTANPNANARSSCAPGDFPSSRSNSNSRVSASHSLHRVIEISSRLA
jgi:hypothetical protein